MAKKKRFRLQQEIRPLTEWEWELQVKQDDQEFESWLKTQEGIDWAQEMKRTRTRHNLKAFGYTEMQGRILSKDLIGCEFQWEIGPFADGSVVPCRVMLDWKDIKHISTKEVGEDCSLWTK